MNEFIYLSNLDNRNISLQIIKSFAILILSISNTQTLYYLFSNNFINQIIGNDFEKYDEEFVSHYVNFLKSLISKLDKITIQFFFQKNFNSFPLCNSVLKLYNYPDGMIKNTVRNIILSLLKLNFEPLIDYFSSLPAIQYFSYLSLVIRDLIIKLNEEITGSDYSYNGLLSIQDDIIIDILFIQDIFSLENAKITNILINNLFHFTILPLLCGSICAINRPKIAISTALYSLILFFQHIKNESFNNLLYSLLFFPQISRKINKTMLNYPNAISNYYSSWENQKKQGFLNYIQYISSNFSEPFIYSLIAQHTNVNGEEILSDYKEINEMRIKLRKMFKESIDLSNPNHYQPVLQQILKPFQKEKLDLMMDNHKNLSIASGVNIGLFSDNHKRHSFISQMHKLFYKIKTEKDILNKMNEDKQQQEMLLQLHLMKNEIRSNLYSYLTSKDDCLIQLVSLLLYVCSNKNISKELQSHAGLLSADYMTTYDYNLKDTESILNEIFNNINVSSIKEESSIDTIENKEIKESNKINDINQNQLKISFLTSPVKLNTSNVMDYYQNLNNDGLQAFDNIFYKDLLKEFTQVTYDHNIIDIHLDVSK